MICMNKKGRPGFCVCFREKGNEEWERPYYVILDADIDEDALVGPLDNLETIKYVKKHADKSELKERMIEVLERCGAPDEACEAKVIITL